MGKEYEPMSEAVRKAYIKSLGLDKYKPSKRKVRRRSFASEHPELYDRELLVQLKAELVSKYGERCMCCGSVERVVVEHIKSRRYGGSNEFSNLQLLCSDCNIKKGHCQMDYRPF